MYGNLVNLMLVKKDDLEIDIHIKEKAEYIIEKMKKFTRKETKYSQL